MEKARSARRMAAHQEIQPARSTGRIIGSQVGQASYCSPRGLSKKVGILVSSAYRGQRHHERGPGRRVALDKHLGLVHFSDELGSEDRGWWPVGRQATPIQKQET